MGVQSHTCAGITRGPYRRSVKYITNYRKPKACGTNSPLHQWAADAFTHSG